MVGKTLRGRNKGQKGLRELKGGTGKGFTLTTSICNLNIHHPLSLTLGISSNKG
jgi:hypothetical protein